MEQNGGVRGEAGVDEEGGGDEGLQRDSVRRGDAARGHSPLLLSAGDNHGSQWSLYVRCCNV